MPNSIESKIHSILLDIDPGFRDYEDQSIIIAEASANYRVAHKFNVKEASKQIEEADIIDCLLQAMTVLSENSASKVVIACDNIVEDGELDYESVLKNVRTSSDKDFSMDEDNKNFGMNTIISDDDLDVFFSNDDDVDDMFKIEDVYEERHPSDLYEVPGYGQHRTDWRVR
jgi:hypothetical protein